MSLSMEERLKLADIDPELAEVRLLTSTMKTYLTIPGFENGQIS